ncbi:hypothetical protein RFI_29810, partial [Reticulomyxa filosa]
NTKSLFDAIRIKKNIQSINFHKLSNIEDWHLAKKYWLVRHSKDQAKTKEPGCHISYCNKHSGKHNIYKQLRQAKPLINTNLDVSINFDNISIINVYINSNWIETMNKEPVQLSDKILEQRLDITALLFGKYCYENGFDCSTIYNHTSLYIQYQLK